LNKCGVELGIIKRPYRGLPQLAVCKLVCASSAGILPSRRLNIVRLPEAVVWMILAVGPEKNRSSALCLIVLSRLIVINGPIGNAV
jgi:hypothetical protein